MATFIDVPISSGEKLICVMSNYISFTNQTKLSSTIIENDPRLEPSSTGTSFKVLKPVTVGFQYAVQHFITSGTASKVTIGGSYKQGDAASFSLGHTFDNSATERARTTGITDMRIFSEGISFGNFESHFHNNTSQKVACFVYVYILD